MSEKILVLIGTWLVSDSLYSLRVYWGKEGIFEQGIRALRLILAMIIIVLAFFGAPAQFPFLKL